MTIGKVDVTKNFCRYRQKPVKAFDKRSFRTKKISKETDIVIACPRGKWNNTTKRCKVGTQAQTILKKRHGKKCPKKLK